MNIIEPLDWPVGRHEVNDTTDVRLVQDLLDDALLACHLRRYGVFDTNTERSLIRFQTRVQTPPTGRVTPYGPTFWYLLDAAQAGLDEITPIAAYIAQEMKTNANGATVQRLRRLNDDSAAACQEALADEPIWKRVPGKVACQTEEWANHVEALRLWTSKVQGGADWDHKRKIARRFHPRVAGPEPSQVWHLYGLTLYFYDVWSNIHYGYVGRAAGFSAETLLTGASLEQLRQNLSDFRLPTRQPDTPTLQSFDDPRDRKAIQIGIDLYQQDPRSVTDTDVLRAVLNATKALRTKPMPIPP